MARPPRFIISALADLLKELRYAPPETRHRQMTAAEHLLSEIDPERNYPEDYVRFRITGYRGEKAEASLFVGSALLGDLSTFIERLSASLEWTAKQYAPRKALLPEEVATQLKVSAVTLHRYRRQGLVAHQAVLEGGRPRLVYFADAVERFAAARAGRVSAAGRFTRIDSATRDRIIRRARRYAQSLDLSLNESAKRLAKRFGRSHEGIRRLLQQNDRSHPEAPIFSDLRPLTDRQRLLVLRAHDRAIPASDLAPRLGKTVSTIYRTVIEQRAERLRSWNVRGVELPTFRLPGAAKVILASKTVSQNLPTSLHTGGEFIGWIEEAAVLEFSGGTDESQAVAALHFLLWSAGRIIRDLPVHQPHAADVDEAETRLRWATRLKVRLLAGLRVSALSTIEIHLARKLTECPARDIEAAYQMVLTVLGRTIDSFDAARQGRLKQVAIHALRTELARRRTEVTASTARARHERYALILEDRPEAISPWRAALELPSGAVGVKDRLSEDDRAILGARFGWGGEAPQTQAQIARTLGRPVHRIAAAEQRARRTLAQQLRLSRSGEAR